MQEDKDRKMMENDRAAALLVEQDQFAASDESDHAACFHEREGEEEERQRQDVFLPSGRCAGFHEREGQEQKHDIKVRARIRVKVPPVGHSSQS